MRNDDLALDDLERHRRRDRRGPHRPRWQATEACLARIEAWQPRTNAFLRVYKEKALEQARAMDAELAAGKRRGPLHGVPMAHKDMYYRKGEVSTGGSRIRRRLGGAGDGSTVLRQARCGRRGRAGLPQHGGVRRRPDRPQRPSRPLPQSVGPDARHRRQLERLGRLGRRAHGLWRAGLGHRRLDPPARRGLRRGRHEGDLRPRQPRRRRRALVEPRPCRAADPHRARQCPHAGVIAGHDPDDSTTSEKPVPDYEALLEGGVARPADRLRLAERRAGAARSRRSAPPCRPPPTRWAGSAPRSSPVDAARLHRSLSGGRSDGEVRGGRHAPAVDGEDTALYANQVRTRMEAGFFIPATQYIDALRLRAHFVRGVPRRRRWRASMPSCCRRSPSRCPPSRKPTPKPRAGRRCSRWSRASPA